MDDNQTCLACMGVGYINSKLCPDCQGSGKVSRRYYAVQGSCVFIALLAGGLVFGWSFIGNILKAIFRLLMNPFDSLASVVILVVLLLWVGAVFDDFSHWWRQRSKQKPN
jgi:hypothetical protein